jgi:hypothetical protein
MAQLACFNGVTAILHKPYQLTQTINFKLLIMLEDGEIVNGLTTSLLIRLFRHVADRPPRLWQAVKRVEKFIIEL